VNFYKGNNFNISNEGILQSRHFTLRDVYRNYSFSKELCLRCECIEELPPPENICSKCFCVHSKHVRHTDRSGNNIEELMHNETPV
ncbi:unnamed protein product, partial [Schistosoma turkestanicum]